MRDPLEQLSGKRRTYDDLIRFIGSRVTGAPNYSLLLGAGCSVSSNIRSASALIDEWRREVFLRLSPEQEYDAESAIAYLTKNHADWYNPQREYSSLFEKNFDLPRQRRMFVEQEVAGKIPNLGYAYLIRLIEEGYVNTAFTTNFDDLLNEAFFQYSSVRPIVCAHDSSIGSITVTSKRPKIIKLHGDYLFDDIKATVRETESLEDNIRRKFAEFCRDFGLVVVGYGGADRSIMDVLQYLLRSEEYFKHGVYWCVRRGEQPSDELLKLLWRDRVYFVEIDGFDELMAELHDDLVGQSLPIDTGVVTEKPSSIINGFCSNLFLNDSKSLIIKRDLGRLRKQAEREELLTFLRDAKDDASQGGPSETLSERELMTVLQLKENIASGEFDAVRDKISAELDKKPSKPLREELSELRVRVEELAGDLPAAISAVNFLIEEDPQEAENYIRKTYLTISHGERMEILAQAESVDPDNFRVYFRRAACCVEAYLAGVVSERGQLLTDIESNFERSWDLDPGLRNPAWGSAIHFYEAGYLPKDVVKERLDSIAARCAERGASRIIPLRARLARWSRYKEDRSSPEADSLIKDISEARLKSSKSVRPFYEWLELDAYLQLGREGELSRRLSELAANSDFAEAGEYLRRKADFLLKFNGDLTGAIATLKQAIDVEARRADILKVARWMEFVGDGEAIRSLGEKYAPKLRPAERLQLRRSECCARDDHEAALTQLRAIHSKSMVGDQDVVDEVHDLLLLTRYAEAEKSAKEVLDRVQWNKLMFGPLIINHELAVQRQGRLVSKKRLSDLSEATLSEEVKACAYYLNGNIEGARKALLDLIRADKEYKFVVPAWAIFADAKGKKFAFELISSTS